MATAEYAVVGVTRLLEALREAYPEARFYQDILLGDVRASPRDPRASRPLLSACPTARRGLGAASSSPSATASSSASSPARNGILFNHESTAAGSASSPARISQGVAVGSELGLSDGLALGNLDVRRDWGYAKEYVEAMWMMLQRRDRTTP